jgi:MFS family permease
MANLRSTEQSPITGPSAGLLGRRRVQAFAFGGLLLVLMNFSAPDAGMIDLPVTFFLKNRMHLQANEMAVFKLWIGIPLILGFVFGFIRDRWSPFGRGDRAHILLFGLLTALIYGLIALMTPGYAVFLGGLFVATMAFKMVSSAVYGVVNTLAQKHAVTGQMSSLIIMGSTLPNLISNIGGGMLSQTLGGQSAEAAARILFFCAGGLMVSIAVLGFIGPKWVFDEAREEVPTVHFMADLRRIARHWPIYPVMLIQLMWFFGPAAGTVLQYHFVDHWHGTDAQWGLYQGIGQLSFVPLCALYGWLSQKFSLRPLLWVGFSIAVVSAVPLLLIQDTVGALYAAVPCGLMSALASAALLDLLIRSAPRGCQGATMMLFGGCQIFSIRAGDLLGTWIYDKHGGFSPTVIVTTIVYALILPLLLLVPKRLTATKDGEVIEGDGAHQPAAL